MSSTTTTTPDARSIRLAKLAAQAEARSRVLAGEDPAPPSPKTEEEEEAATSLPLAAATAASPAPPPLSAEQKKQEREARLLAKAELRMKVVNGEVKLEVPVEAAQDDAVAAAAPEEKDNRGRWERRWGETVQQTEVREVSPEFLKKLDVTAEMAVEAPRSVVSAEEELAALRRINQKLNGGGAGSLSLARRVRDVDWASALTSLVLVGLGVASGLTNGQFVADQVWLPWSSLVLLALALRMLAVTSLERVGLGKRPASTAAAAAAAAAGGGGWGSHWMVKMALQMLPPPASSMLTSAMNFAGYMKDSNDDMLLFVFAHGVAFQVVRRLSLGGEIAAADDELAAGEFTVSL